MNELGLRVCERCGVALNAPRRQFCSDRCASAARKARQRGFQGRRRVVVRGAAQGVQVGGGFDDAVNAAPAGLIAAASGMLVSARQQAQRNSRLSEQLSSSEAAIQTVAAQYAQVLADARVLALLVSHLVGASAPGGKLASLLGRYLPDGFNPSPGVDGAGSKPAAGNNSVEHFGGDA